jgi:HPt (histidine-containing phosphotransfer) domain-containing protein
MRPTDSETEIDFDHLNQYVAGDADLTAEVFGLFKNQVDMLGRSLLREANDETWQAVTHSLRGTALAVGATKLAELCGKAEQLIGAGNRLGGRDVAIQDIEFRISRTMAEIQRWEYRQTLNRMRGK